MMMKHAKTEREKTRKKNARSEALVKESLHFLVPSPPHTHPPHPPNLRTISLFLLFYSASFQNCRHTHAPEEASHYRRD